MIAFVLLRKATVAQCLLAFDKSMKRYQNEVNKLSRKYKIHCQLRSNSTHSFNDCHCFTSYNNSNQQRNTYLPSANESKDTKIN